MRLKKTNQPITFCDCLWILIWTTVKTKSEAKLSGTLTSQLEIQTMSEYKMILTKDHQLDKCLWYQTKQIGPPASGISPQHHLLRDPAGPSPLLQGALEALFQPDLLSLAFCLNPTGSISSHLCLCSCCSLPQVPPALPVKSHPSLEVSANSTSSGKHFLTSPPLPSFWAFGTSPLFPIHVTDHSLPRSKFFLEKGVYIFSSLEVVRSLVAEAEYSSGLKAEAENPDSATYCCVTLGKSLHLSEPQWPHL